MRLGLGGLARAVAGAAGTCLVVLAAFAVGVAGTGAIATGADLPGSWTVTVGPANRTLFPGTAATMPYDVHNGTAGSLRLQSTTASVHVRGGTDGCRGDWFRISSNIVPTDVEVAPGDSVHGSLVVAFDSAAISQDACKNVSVDVVVTAS